MDRWHIKQQQNIEATNDYLGRIRTLAEGKGTTLPQTDNSIWNYKLDELSRMNLSPPESVRAARFNDGTFMSFRLKDSDAVALQYDFAFYDDTFDSSRPRVIPYRVIDYKNQLVRTEYVHRSLESYHTYGDDGFRELARRALVITAAEAAADKPWPLAYTQDELLRARFRRNQKIIRIALNPTLGEPYL